MTMGSFCAASPSPSSHLVRASSCKETAKYRCCAKINPTTSVQFGSRSRSRTWLWKGVYNNINDKNNNVGLGHVTRSYRNPYVSSWIEMKKRTFIWFMSRREIDPPYDHPYPYYPGCGDGGGDGGGGGRRGGGRDLYDNFGFGDYDNSEELAIPIINFEEVKKQIESRGADLSVFPSDVLEVIRKEGIRIKYLQRYLDLQERGWLLAFLMRHCSFIRDRMLADPDFLVKLTKQLAIYSCSTTAADLHRKGKDFWAEFEVYAADLFVGLLVKSVGVSLFAPIVPIGQQSFIGQMLQPILAFTTHYWDSECIFMDPLNVMTVMVIYGAAGFVCSLIGQGIANEIMTAKRKSKKSKGDVSVPPLINNAMLWGLFSGVDLGFRYMVVSVAVRYIDMLVEWSKLGKLAAIPAQAIYISLNSASDFYGRRFFVYCRECDSQ